MTQLLTELKTRARLMVNAARRAEAAAPAEESAKEVRLRDCLNRVAQDVGFAHWEHARRVLGGMAEAGEDMGTFWWSRACERTLNQWFASHAQARVVLQAEPASVLLPYRRQFVLVDADCIRELALDPEDPAWGAAGRDLAQGYGSQPWLNLAMRRIKAPATAFRR